MIYADTDFFVALLKPSDWLKKAAERILNEHPGQIWTSPTTLTELLLLAAEFKLDPERLLVDVLEIAGLRGGDANVFFVAAGFMKEQGVGVFDALHAAHCGDSVIISSDKMFDRLGLRRIRLEEKRAA